MVNNHHLAKVESFRQLHQQDTTFVLPNAWDPISAMVFEEAGFQAIGTSSAGIAASLGYSDGQHIPFEKMLEAIGNIARSVRVPVSADIESGYGETAEDVANAVKKITDTGVVGINLEDATGDPDLPLYDVALQAEKITAIKELVEATEKKSLFINARTDTYWLQTGDPATRLHETLKRLKAFEKAGADCVFIPGLHDREVIQELRKEITCPINLLASPDMPTLKELTDIGIDRVSCGSGPFRATVKVGS